MSYEVGANATPVVTSAAEPRALFLLPPEQCDAVVVSELAAELDSAGFPAHVYGVHLPTDKFLDPVSITLVILLLSHGLTVLEGAAGNATWAAIKLAVGRFLSRQPETAEAFTLVVRSNQSTDEIIFNFKGKKQVMQQLISGAPLSDVLEALKQ
jgi:hypothetical protein